LGLRDLHHIFENVINILKLKQQSRSSDLYNNGVVVAVEKESNNFVKSVSSHFVDTNIFNAVQSPIGEEADLEIIEFKSFFDEINRLDIEETFQLDHFPHLDHETIQKINKITDTIEDFPPDYQLKAIVNLSLIELPEALKLLCEVSYEYMQALKESEDVLESATRTSSTLQLRLSIAERLDRHLFYLIGIVHSTQRGFVMDMRAGLLADFGVTSIQCIMIIIFVFYK
jgi:hypothetical protein